MSKIVTQSKLNELVGGTVDLGKGGYCPTYKEIVDNWQGEAIEINITSARVYYDAYADDSYSEVYIKSSTEVPVDIEVYIEYSTTGTGDWHDWEQPLVINATNDTAYDTWGGYYSPTYFRIKSVRKVNLSDPDVNLSISKEVVYSGPREKYNNFIVLDVGQSGIDVTFTLTATAPVTHGVDINIEWDEYNNLGNKTGHYSTLLTISEGEISTYYMTTVGVVDAEGYTQNEQIMDVTPTSDEYCNYLF